MKRGVLLIGGGFLLVSAGNLALLIGVKREAQDLVADPTNTEQVSFGEQIYRQNCASCHGANLEGQPDWQSRKVDGRLPAPSHDETGHTWHHSDEVLIPISKEGVSAIVPNYESDMPAYDGALTDEEIWTAIAFIKSRWPQRLQDIQAVINRRAIEQKAQ
jgi:mono/diheme cytochrome c family protein